MHVAQRVGAVAHGESELEGAVRASEFKWIDNHAARNRPRGAVRLSGGCEQRQCRELRQQRIFQKPAHIVYSSRGASLRGANRASVPTQPTRSKTAAGDTCRSTIEHSYSA